MAARNRTIFLGIGIFVAGLVVGLVGGRFVGLWSIKTNLDNQALISMQATAQRAQTELLQLQLLRSGRVEQVVGQLELFIDSRSAALDYFDQTLSPSPELTFSRRVLQDIRAYTEDYPGSTQ
jgi:hypothetical protein